jgi:hypothetical protein
VATGDLSTPRAFQGDNVQQVQGQVSVIPAGGIWSVIDPDIVLPVNLSATGSATTPNDQNTATAGILLTGTWSGTVQFEGSVDGSTWQAVTAYPFPSGSGVTSATANGAWQASMAGLTAFRVRCSIYVSGTITGQIRLSAAVIAFPTPSSVAITYSGSVTSQGSSDQTGSAATPTISPYAGQNLLDVRDPIMIRQLDTVILLLQDVALRLSMIASDTQSGRGQSAPSSNIYLERFPTNAS